MPRAIFGTYVHWKDVHCLPKILLYKSIFWFRISEKEKEITDLENELDSLKDAVEHQRKKNNVSKSLSE